MDEKKLSEILKDEDFIEEVFTTATSQEIKEIFRKKGVELSDKETEKIIEIFEQNIENASVLPNERLQNISGGISVPQEADINLENFLINNTEILKNAQRWKKKIKN